MHSELRVAQMARNDPLLTSPAPRGRRHPHIPGGGPGSGGLAPANPPKLDTIMTLSQVLDARPALITDFRHRNRDETGVIMAKIREE
jgi:hypothetical protein